MQLCGSLNILWLSLSLGLEWKVTFSSPVATAEFSKFAGILSAAVSQHHLLDDRSIVDWNTLRYVYIVDWNTLDGSIVDWNATILSFPYRWVCVVTVI